MVCGFSSKIKHCDITLSPLVYESTSSILICIPNFWEKGMYFCPMSGNSFVAFKKMLHESESPEPLRSNCGVIRSSIYVSLHLVAF